MEELIFGGAYLWREICVSKSIGLALSMEANLPYLRALSKYKHPGGLVLGKCVTEGFLRYEFGGLYLEGLIHGGAYFWNFTVLNQLGKEQSVHT